MYPDGEYYQEIYDEGYGIGYDKGQADMETQLTHYEALVEAWAENTKKDAIEQFVKMNAGRELHRAWRDNMIDQGRKVSAERMEWESLPHQDKELDKMIAREVLTDFVFWMHFSHFQEHLVALSALDSDADFKPDPPPCNNCGGTGDAQGFSNEPYLCPKCNGSGYFPDSDAEGKRE